MTQTLEGKRQKLAVVASHLAAHPRLLRLATSLAKGFKPTVAASLQRAQQLAYWLYVYEHRDLCLQVCRLLNDVPFEQDYNRWTWVELTLALEWKLRSEAGEGAAAQACLAIMQAAAAQGEPSMQRIKAAAMQHRLSGVFLRSQEIAEAERCGDRASARTYRFLKLGELLFLQAHGGSDKFHMNALDQEATAQLTALRA